MHWNIVHGNTAVLCNLPTPLSDPFNRDLITNLPSGEVQVPKLIDVKGSLFDLLCYLLDFLF
jgi:hypothetical protein